MSTNIIFNYMTFYNYYTNPSNFITETNNKDCVELYYFTNTKNKSQIASKSNPKCTYIEVNGIKIYISTADRNHVFTNLDGNKQIEKTHMLLFSIPTLIGGILFDVHYHFGIRHDAYKMPIADKHYIENSAINNKKNLCNKTRKHFTPNRKESINTILEEINPSIGIFPINKNEKLIFFHKTIQEYINMPNNTNLNIPLGYNIHKHCHFQDNTPITNINNIVCLDNDHTVMGRVLDSLDKILLNEIMRRPFISNGGKRKTKRNNKIKYK